MYMFFWTKGFKLNTLSALNVFHVLKILNNKELCNFSAHILLTIN